MAIPRSQMTEERMETLASRATLAYLEPRETIKNVDLKEFMKIYLDVYEVALEEIRERENKRVNNSVLEDFGNDFNTGGRKF